MRLMFCIIGHFPIDWYHDDWWCTCEKYKLLDSASSFGTIDTFVQKGLILVQHLVVTCSCCMICSVPLNLFAKSRSLRFGRNLHMEDFDRFCCALLSFHLLSSAGGLWGKAVPAKAQVAGTPSGGIAECRLTNSRQVSTHTLTEIHLEHRLVGGNSTICYVHPLGKWSNFTHIFQIGWWKTTN